MESIFDLPAHPLFVHFPIVLVPLAALGAIVLVFNDDLRRRYGLALAAATFVGAIATILAAASGEPFNDLLPLGDVADKHRDLGETARLLSIVFFVTAAAMVGIERFRPSLLSPTALRALSGVVAVVGVLATIWMIRTGHEGARITWDGVLPKE